MKKETQITYIWKPKCDTNELICETKTDSDIENRFMVAKGEAGKGKIGSFGLTDASYYI